jgi:hypothetical protein
MPDVSIRFTEENEGNEGVVGEQKHSCFANP